MITLHHGDARDVLATLPEKSVQCCVTSPPYFNLRAYGTDPREIGRETTPAAYVAALVAVFAEVWRVLRDDGVCWINLGDCYSAGGTGGASSKSTLKNDGREMIGARNYELKLNESATQRKPPAGMQSKQLLGMPWRVAFALQDDGWILRSDIIWSKPNPMPESVTDRPTRAHEYLFLFAKQQRYFYDATAIAEDVTGNTHSRGNGDGGGKMAGRPDGVRHWHGSKVVSTRNRRTVWTIATQPYAGAHFATMPEALIEPCVLAGSASQACETCGAAWGRVIETRDPIVSTTVTTGAATDQRNDRSAIREDTGRGAIGGASLAVHRIGTDRFAPRCACATNTGSARSVVLDPFGGSGTVARVAERFQRDSILIDLNADYLELQAARTDGVQREFTL